MYSTTIVKTEFCHMMKGSNGIVYHLTWDTVSIMPAYNFKNNKSLVLWE